MMRAARVLMLLAAVGLLGSSIAAAQDAPTEPPSSDASRAPEPAADPVVSTPKPTSLGELLDLVEQGFSEERQENRQRVERFRRAKDDQVRLLEEASADLARSEARGELLEAQFEQGEADITNVQADLEERTGNLGELFGVVRQVAGDMQAHAWESVTSSQLGSREAILKRLGRSKELPSTEDLEKLWFELHREMTQQGMVVRYRTPVLSADGQEAPREVVRAGVFSVVSDGRYLLWDSAIQKIRELNRQPPSRYVNTVAPYEASSSGFARLAVDPSRGALLSALIDTPNRTERVQQGGPVGYTIIGLGIIALIVGVVRWLALASTSRKVSAQRRTHTPDAGNPLGRVLAVYDDNKRAAPEALEMKLDEVVLREAGKLEQLLWLVKVVSVVAPLLGLLGTVTGMIQTFQAITLFGAGDPKMMAGGISEALVTTMLGLMVAIPLVLLHATLSRSARRIAGILVERSAGLVALRIESEDA